MRPTWAEINLDRLSFNFHSVKNFVGPNINFMAVVKANAYGHNAVKCARRLEAEGVDWFGVALPEEGIEIRAAGIKTPILCMGSFWLGQENLLLENNLTPVIFQIEKAEAFDKAAKNRGIKANFHIKIDTGMGRIGVRFDEAEDFIEKLKDFQNINIEGVMTHFAAADNLSENDFTQLQINRFKDCVSIIEAKGFRPLYKDMANSPGAVCHKNSRENLVRIGGILYGLGGDVLPQKAAKPELLPVMSIHTRIAQLKKVPKGETLGYGRTFETQRDSLIATIPIGYQDGLPRVLSNNGRVIIKDHYAPIVGRISMDWTIIDVTDISNVKLDDEVIIVGQNKGLSILAEELAEKSNTISYEITCGINRRVSRKYVGGK